MTTRADIAAALSALDGVQGHVYRPATPRPGDAWPLTNGFARPDDSPMFLLTWRILVVLPQDERAASKWLDANWWMLVDGLDPVVFVAAIDPVELAVAPGGTMYALQITGRSE
jgi:hypothetical protein